MKSKKLKKKKNFINKNKEKSLNLIWRQFKIIEDKNKKLIKKKNYTNKNKDKNLNLTWRQ